jgi:hypothetical protein
VSNDGDDVPGETATGQATGVSPASRAHSIDFRSEAFAGETCREHGAAWLAWSTARAKTVAGLDEVTRTALERGAARILGDGQPPHGNVVAMASWRR